MLIYEKQITHSGFYCLGYRLYEAFKALSTLGKEDLETLKSDTNCINNSTRHIRRNKITLYKPISQ